MFKQSDAIRDYVIPIAAIDLQGGDRVPKRILGTAFLIGDRGFALTAKHVISGADSERLVGVFAVPPSGWFGFGVTAREAHPTEDVAVLKLDGGPWKSFLRLVNTSENASCKYRLFGYPDDTTFELTDGKQALIRPDLVYNEGYVRRRFDGMIPRFFGRAFYELSEVAGTGASGAPVCKLTAPIWEVIGVYAGEKINDRATSVSYCTRTDAFADWVPGIVGVSVLEESSHVAV